MRRSLSALVLAVFAMAGCSDITGGGGANGSVSFTYSGAASGTYSTSGPPSGPGTIYAATRARYSDGVVSIDAYMPVNGAQGHVLLLTANVTGSGPQTVTFSETSCTAPCATGFVIYNAYITAGIPLSGFAFQSGEVTFTQISSSRVKGTFRGSAIFRSTGGVIQVENGQFDIPVSD